MRRLRRDIAFLSQTGRAIIYSYNYQGKSIAKITREMGMPEGTETKRIRHEKSRGVRARSGGNRGKGLPAADARLCNVMECRRIYRQYSRYDGNGYPLCAAHTARLPKTKR